MRETTKALIGHYTDHLDISGDVLEIGGHRLANCAISLFPEPRYRYHDLNITTSDIPNTIVADITGCRDEIPDESFDLVLSSDVFEHIDRPWLAAAEIARILRPGGIAITHTLFSWRNHPCPIDYWRYSAECLEFLFGDLECLEKGYDLSQRRHDQPGFWPSGADSVPVDALGGWREHWSVYAVTRKRPADTGPTGRPVTALPPVPAFKNSSHPLAVHLRQDTQGVVTNPAMLGTRSAAAQRPDLSDRLAGLEAQILGLGEQLAQHLAQHLGRPNRRASRPDPLATRAWRSTRRRLVARRHERDAARP